MGGIESEMVEVRSINRLVEQALPPPAFDLSPEVADPSGRHDAAAVSTLLQLR
jgi:hypothetical protein